MGGTGVEKRMEILRDAGTQQILKPFQTHGWHTTVSVEDSDGEYLVIEAEKTGVTRRVALLYSSATSNLVYKKLDTTVDHIFTNGDLYQIESFAHGIKASVSPVSEFFPVLIAWNKQLDPVKPGPPIPPRPSKGRIITSENPLAAIWSRLDQFASVTLAKKLVKRRAAEKSVELQEDVAAKKAEGVAFSLRNASDYFKGIPADSLNKRILTLYYGTMALAFAEMLAAPQGARDLDEVEGMTKYGHGLYVLPSSNGDLGGVHVGLLASGFFPRWAAFLGHDIGNYPKDRAKTASDLDKKPRGTTTTMRELLGAIPELGDLFLDVFEDTAPSWVTPIYQLSENTGGMGLGGRKSQSTYIHLIDDSGLISEDQIRVSGWSLAELTRITPSEHSSDRGFRARVDHQGKAGWYEVLPVHNSPFRNSPALIIPVIGGFYEFRTISMITLYALSILVRYMPSAWRRVEGGDWDKHLSLVKNAAGVFERVLPEHFLESILHERIWASQPGHF